MRIAQILVGLATSAFLVLGGCGDSASGLSTDGAAELDAPASTGGSLGGSGGAATGGAGGTAPTDVSTVAEVDGSLDLSSLDASSQLPACMWPSPVDAGPGACGVGRAYVECTYPAGVACDSGLTYTSPNGGVTMLCLSDDATGCPGCHPIAGTATCKNICAPGQYAMACGGPPKLALDGGYDQTYYQEPPSVCALVRPTPSGVGYWCCPCE